MNIKQLKQSAHSFIVNLIDHQDLPDAKSEISKAHYFERLATHEHQTLQSLKQSSNDRNAVWYYLRAALRGDAEAAFKLGESYLHGDWGLDKDYRKAQYWLDRAVSLGHPKARAYLYNAFSEIAFS